MAAVVSSLLLVLVAAVGINEALGWRWLQQPLQRVLERSADVHVRLDGEFRLRLLPRPRVSAQRVVIGAAPGLPVPHLVAAERVFVEARWADLWRWHRGDSLALRTLSADALDAHLLRERDGRASWQLRGHRDTAQTAPTRPRIDTWVMRRGVIHWRDVPMATDLELVLAARDSGNGYGGTLNGSYRELPLQLRIEADGLLPLIDANERTPVALRIEGTAGASKVLFDGRAGALFEARHFEGRIDLGGPSLARVGEALGLTLPNTPAFRLQGQVVHADGVWTLKDAQVRLGGTAFGGDFRFDRRVSPPLLQGHAAGPRMALADLGVAVGVQGEQPGPRVLPQRPFDLPSLRAMRADMTLAFDQLLLGVEVLGPLNDAQARLLLHGGLLRVEDVRAQVAGGRLRGRSELDGNSAEGRWLAQMSMSDVDVARWIRRPSPQGRTPARASLPPLTGELDALLDVRGHGLSTASILGTLEGKAKARLTGGTLSHLVTEGIGLDVAEALGVALSGDRPLPLRCATLDLDVSGGRAVIRRGVVDNSDTTVALGGHLSLRDETLAVAMRARPKDFSPLALRSPITVTGTFDKPRLGIEAKSLAARVLGSAALAVVAPVAALLPLIDFGDPPPSDPCLGRAP